MNTDKSKIPQSCQNAVITRFNFDDLSFSGIVNQIDGDELEAKDYVITAYYEINKQKNLVDELKRELNIQESHMRSLENSIDLVFNHMSWFKPMAFFILRDKFKEMLVVSDSAVTLEKNVL
jgi:hypothetical protein